MPPVHRLLLVEDNPDDVFLFMRAINKHPVKIDVAVAGNAEEALDYLQSSKSEKHRLDLILTDLAMPGWTGIHLVSWIRSQPQFNEIPIVVLSSSGEPRDVSNAYEAGATAYMTKANNFDGYRQIVSKLADYCASPSKPLTGHFVKQLA